MSAFFDYLRNITYYLLFASLVGLLAPTGKYKKFIMLVMGLVLLAMMLQPLRQLINTQIPITNWFAGLIPHEVRHDDDIYAAWRDTYLSAAFEAQLTAQLEALLQASGITMHEASFTHTDDFSRITSVRVRVSREETNEPARVPFIRIEPVQIGREEPLDNPLTAEVINLISGFYNLPPQHIYVITDQR